MVIGCLLSSANARRINKDIHQKCVSQLHFLLGFQTFCIFSEIHQLPVPMDHKKKPTIPTIRSTNKVAPNNDHRHFRVVVVFGSKLSSLNLPNVLENRMFASLCILCIYIYIIQYVYIYIEIIIQ